MSDSPEPDAFIWTSDSEAKDEVHLFPHGSLENEPLFSSETINHKIRFEEKARELENIARKLEAATAEPFDREVVLEQAKRLAEEADKITKLKAEFQEKDADGERS